MFRRVSCLAVLLGLGSGLCPAAEPARPALDSLVKNSPFGSAASPGAVGGESGQLEFRGVFTDKGELFFSFFEPSSRQSQWVGLKETSAPYSVQSYDSATQTVKVQYRGQPLTLSLKRAQIIVQAAPPPPPPGTPAPVAVTGAAPSVGAPAPSADEAARLAQVAEEIRRRRALRAQGNQAPVPQPTPATPAANPTPNRP